MPDISHEQGRSGLHDQILVKLHSRLSLLENRFDSLCAVVDSMIQEKLNDFGRRTSEQVLHTDSGLRYVADTPGNEVARD